MSVIRVNLAGSGYEVHIGRELLERVAETTAISLPRRRVCIVADETAFALHGERLLAGLVRHGREPAVFEISGGEAAKSWARLQEVTEWLLQQGVERGDHVLALGGGVVGDLAGFACAILKRGTGLVQLPTTLLAQVDSSVGGKTAINTAAGKNLVGAFHQPSLVLADLDTLATLPPREFRAGYAEVLKYAVLGDSGFFEWLAGNGYAVLSHKDEALEQAIATSVAAKARIVAEDERETRGSRALLNLGHTFGHAIEAATGFSDRLLHGEAVALGMVLAARYSTRRDHLAPDEAERITRAVSLAGLPSEIAALELDCDGPALIDHMRHDKKMAGGTLPFVLLRSIGAAFLATDVDLADVALFLDEQLQAH